MSTEENKAIVRAWVEAAWNNGDVSSADTLYAADYVYHDPASPVEVRGVEGIKGLVAMYRSGLPDIHFTIEDMVAEGDKVVWRWTVRGTHQGTLFGIPPTGRPGTVTGIIISRFANGKWQEDYNNWDTLGMLQQFGVIPTPQGAGVQVGSKRAGSLLCGLPALARHPSGRGYARQQQPDTPA